MMIIISFNRFPFNVFRYLFIFLFVCSWILQHRKAKEKEKIHFLLLLIKQSIGKKTIFYSVCVLYRISFVCYVPFFWLNTPNQMNICTPSHSFIFLSTIFEKTNNRTTAEQTLKHLENTNKHREKKSDRE